jgi:hypothetical protein
VPLITGVVTVGAASDNGVTISTTSAATSTVLATGTVADLRARHDQNPSADADIALIYVGLGDQRQAMIALNKAYEARFKESILLRPAFDPLRSDARFQDLLRRIGLPQTAGPDLVR